MKKIFVPVLLMLITARSFSQFDAKGTTTIYAGHPTDEKPSIAIMTHSVDNAFENDFGAEFLKSIVLSGNHGDDIAPAEVFDTAGARIFVVSEHNLPKDVFEYRVSENGSEVTVPWNTVSTIQSAPDGPKTMTYIGNFKTQKENFLVIDLRKKGTDSILSTAVISFRRLQPVITNIFLGDEMKDFVKKLTNPDKKAGTPERKKWSDRYSADKLDTTGIPKKLVLNPDQNSIIFFLKQQVHSADQLEYELTRDGKVIRGWKVNDFDNGFVWLTNLPPGDYQLKMRFKIQKENVTTYPFVVKRRWDQTLGFKIIAGGLIAAFFGFLFLLYRVQRQRQKLKISKLQKEKAEIELRSVYSQLNPHFVFNSLSSIQALINKGETESANHYLATFSRLLRESLVNSEKDRVSLSTELKTLETYLELEQLRFHFAYNIEVDEGLQVNNVEIPSLLLQPLVENAIKHGVSALREKGSINIRFDKKGDDLLITITDNGTGFDTSSPIKGFGLKLTRERIRLLSEADKEHIIAMSVNSAKENGTSIELNFKNRL